VKFLKARKVPSFDYEKFSAFFPRKTKWTLQPTRALLRALEFKQKFKAIHVAGTNGKGSVVAFLESVLLAAKLRTGFYSSPHLVRFNERIRANGREVSDAELAALWRKAKPIAGKINRGNKEKISEFEAATATAFKFFESKQCSYAIVECGMGGRLDATNTIKPTVAAITRISLDHTAELGGTVSKIAREKAAVIKRGCAAAIAAESSGAAALRVIKARCKQQGVPFFVVDASRKANVRIEKVKATLNGTEFEVEGSLGKEKLRTRLLGAHQAENAALAWAAAKILQRGDSRITDAAIKKGVENTRCPGRLEVVSKKPLIVFDGAHNPSGAQALASALKKLWPKRKFVLVFAAMRDKDYATVLHTLSPLAKTIVATRVAGNERSASASEIARAARRFCGETLVEENAATALKKAKTLAGMRGGVLVCGSLYLIGELKQAKRRNVF